MHAICIARRDCNGGAHDCAGLFAERHRDVRLLGYIFCAISDFRFLRGITEDDVDAHMMTSVVNSPPLDILIRTSGVKRLSDFLTWQVSDVHASSPYIMC